MVEHSLSETGNIKKISLLSSCKPSILAIRLELLNSNCLFDVYSIYPSFFVDKSSPFISQFSLPTHKHKFLGNLAFHRVKTRKYKSCNRKKNQAKNSALVKYVAINVITPCLIWTLLGVCMLTLRLILLYSTNPLQFKDFALPLKALLLKYTWASEKETMVSFAW